jgi:plastocyanin
VVLAVVLAVTPPAARAQSGGAGAARVAGRVTILERHNRPSPDLGDAVIYLERAGPGARTVTTDVVIRDKVYVPHVLVVPAGSTVRFPNLDPFNHNVFSVSERNPFDLGLYGRGEAKGHTFTAPGLVRVFCNVHPRMVAYVLVLANRWFAQPSGDGTFTIGDVPSGRYRLHVWHERIGAEVVRDVIVAPPGVGDLQLTLDARGYQWQPHKNKLGLDYPTNEGRERY